MDETTCREIQYKVKHFVAPNIEKHPGVVEFSRVCRIWESVASKKDLEKCLTNLTALKLELNGEKYFIFPEILNAAYDKTEKKIKEIEQKIKNFDQLIKRLNLELELLEEINNIWCENWVIDTNNKNVVATSKAVRKFLYLRFDREEKKRLSMIQQQKAERKNTQIQMETLDSQLKSLFDFYSILTEINRK